MADSAVNITAGSGTPIRVLTALGTASADQQVVTLADSAGTLLGTSAAPVPVTAPDTVVTGNITAASGVATQSAGGFTSASLAASSSVVASVSGEATAMVGWSGNASANFLVWEGTVDGTNWTPLYGSLVTETGAFAITTALATGVIRIPVGGLASIRVRSGTSWTASTVAVTIRVSSGSTSVMLADPLPPGSNAIGSVTLGAAANSIGSVAWLGEMRGSTAAVTVTAASGSAATLTLPAAGVGLFHYVTALDICLYSAAARTGAATPWIVTTTNLPGTPSWTFSTAGAIGATERQWLTPTTPLKSSASNTATTVVGPAATGGIWRITATYFTTA